MSQEYEIVWLEQKPTSAGKMKANATLRDVRGVEESVTIWGEFPGYANLRPGYKVTGVITSKADKNNRVWKSLQAGSVANSPLRSPTPVKSAAELTAKSVEKSIDRKEDNIRMASTFRDATVLTAEWMKNRFAAGLSCSTEEWQTEWKNIRNWLDNQYDQPFN